MTLAPTGKIITFYSYKGGTGRSMALANVAWILASNRKKVLVVDWDLEAPGLHRYFYPFLMDKDLTASDGLIDFVLDFAIEGATPSKGAEPDKEWYKAHTNILRYAMSLDWKFPEPGTLDFIPAGRQSSSYARNVNSFNWQKFYDRHGGGVFLEAVKEKLRAEYDYILIDSRTGVSDTSGVCTVQMPDTVVICFTLNYQSIEGASAVASSVRGQRRDPEFRVFPVPMRVEYSEKEKLDQRREVAYSSFDGLLDNLNVEQRTRYWQSVETMYIPYYAYEEMLASFGDKVGHPSPLLESAERLTSYLTDGAVQKLIPPPESSRQEVLAMYVREPLVMTSSNRIKSAERVLRMMAPADQVLARYLLTRLVRLKRSDDVGQNTRLRLRFEDLDESTLELAKELVYTGLLVKKESDESAEQTIELADDSLVQDWDLLKHWIDEDREFLLWRQQLRAAIANWEVSRRDTGALLSGTLLGVARQWRGEKEERLNQKEKAYVEASEALARSQQRRQIGILTAVVLLLIGSFLGYLKYQANQRANRAALAAEAALKTSSEHIDAGKAWMQQFRYADAIAEFSSAIEGKHDNPEAYYRRGLAYFENREYDKSVGDLTMAIQLKPVFAEAYAQRGRSQRNLGNLKLAIEDYNRAIDLKPDLADAFNYRAFAYFKQCRYDDALTDCNKAIDLDKRNASAYDTLGSIYMAKVDFDNAILNFKKATDIKPDFAPAFYNLGRAYAEKLDFKQALDNVQRSIALKPTDPEAYLALGLVYSGMGSSGAAIADFKNAIDLAPGYGEAYYRRGLAYYRRRAYALAKNDFKLAIDTLPPESPLAADAYFYRGSVYRELNDYDAQIADFKKALELLKADTCLTRDESDKRTSNILQQLAPARIILCYDDPDDQSRVSRMAQDLKDLGFGVEVKQRHSNVDGSVRYFFEEDRSKAERIERAVEKLLADTSITLHLQNLVGRPSVPRGTIEVWLPSLRGNTNSLKQAN
jgi:tetratricopeptide (TPR) repeat protein/MinD-like ATPase involved in chromosome partitioning or flagellar assembly